MGLEPEEEKQMLRDRYGPKVRPLAYITQVPRITEVGREHGYAICVHGSLQRDLDLVACPWSAVASDAETLIKAICETVGGFMLPDHEATPRDHGRTSWIVHTGAGLYLDISVMPREEDWGGRDGDEMAD